MTEDELIREVEMALKDVAADMGEEAVVSGGWVDIIRSVVNYADAPAESSARSCAGTDWNHGQRRGRAAHDLNARHPLAGSWTSAGRCRSAGRARAAAGS